MSTQARVLAQARAARVVELRAQVWTYQAIADDLGYTGAIAQAELPI